MSQYNKDDVTVLVDDERVEQLKNFEPPEIDREEEFDKVVGDDDNVHLVSDDLGDLEGEIEVSPTSGTISSLDDYVEGNEETTVTIKHPADDAEDNKVYQRASFTGKSYANSFDDDATSPPNRTYTFIADDIS